MTTGTTETISSRVLEKGEGLIVTLPVDDAQKISIPGSGNVSIPTVRAYFFKVTKSQDYYWRYDQLTGFNQGESRNFDYLGDTSLGVGDDILRLESDDFKVYHFGVGLDSDDLRVYEKVAPSNPNRAVDHDNQQQPNPTAPTPFGFYDGSRISDKYDPPQLTERLSIRNDRVGEFINFGFYADQTVAAADTTLHLTGKTYQLRPVTDRTEQQQMIQANARRRAGQDTSLNVIKTQVGGLYSYEAGQSIPSEWSRVKNAYQDLEYAASSPPNIGGGQDTEVGASPHPGGSQTR